MCGIAGLFDRSLRSSRDDLHSICLDMIGTLAHRGPDDSGIWCDAAAGVVLGHRRLSVVDLSPHGHQPMWSASRRYALVYNGEVYNFLALRRELAARSAVFRGTGDTEVLLACIEQWGIHDALRRLNGMYAFALWDATERTLTLARDRFGEKPLYFAQLDSRVVFASELQALQKCPRRDWSVDRAALVVYLRDLCVPAPYSIIDKVSKLLPGTFATFAADDGSSPRVVRYWSAGAEASGAVGSPFRGSFEDAVDETERALRESVRERMIADVPLGAFLSGGIDSSAVVAMMAAESTMPVRTFTVGFDDSEFDEGPFARAVAHALGAEHEELYLTEANVMTVVPDIASVYDEPFADASQLPTVLVSRLARRQVTVALTGDGGDELFGGYSHYDVIPRWWRRLSALPRPCRRLGVAALERVPRAVWNAAGRTSPSLQGFLERFDDPTDAARRLRFILGAESLEALYGTLVQHWKNPDRVVLGGTGTTSGDPTNPPFGVAGAELLMLRDAVDYLPNDILVKVDRATMSVGLESRLPLLDHHLFRLAWSLPLEYKRRQTRGKLVLKAVLARYLPTQLFDRPKRGFSVPIGRWLAGPLRDWAEALLDEGRLKDEGLFEHRMVRSAWRRHLAGEAGYAYQVWAVLQFQAWHQRTFGAS